MLLLMRHGETDMNLEGIVQGQSGDGRLTAEGVRQVRESAESLRGLPVHGVFCSRLRRAGESAEVVRETLGLQCGAEELAGLEEFDFGAWEGRRREEMPENRYDVAGHTNGGETMEQVFQRAHAALVELVARFPEGDCVVVSHGGTLRALVSRLWNVPWTSFKTPVNATVVRVPKCMFIVPEALRL